MHDVAAGIGSAGLVRHGVHDAEQRIGERHAGKALGIVHPVAGFHVAVVGRHEVAADHLDGMQRERIGIIAMERGNIRFDRVGHGIHAGVCGELLGHGLRKRGIHDGHVWRDVEVSQRVLDALCIVRDDGECGHLGRRAGSGRDGAEVRLGAQRREVERDAEILEGGLRIFVERPHGLRRIDRGTAADGNDPVRLELAHCRRALHDRFDGRIGLNAFKHRDFHARFLQVVDDLVQEAETLHGAAADHDDRLLAPERLKRIKRVLAVVKIPWECKPCHILKPPDKII